MKEQSYKNHRQVVYSYYLFTGLPILVLIAISIKSLTVNSGSRDLWVISLFIGYILLTMLFRARGFALKAQDRAIRAEENLRHFALTGKLLDSRLGLKQIIALRFASDEELPKLARKAAEENLNANTIKEAIKNWRPDAYRV